MKRKIRLLSCVLILCLCPLVLAACGAPTAPTHEKDITEAFGAIRIDIDGASNDANVTILPAANGITRVEGALRRGRTLTCEVADGVLTVKVEDTRPRWMRLFSRRSSLTVYLGGSAYGDLTVDGGTGDVTVGEGLAFGDIAIDASTGDVSLSAVTANALTVDLSTGDVTLSDVNISGDVKITQSTGKIEIGGLTAKNITLTGRTGALTLSDITALGAVSILRTTGDVTGSNMAASALTAETDTGDVSFSDVISTGAVTVTTTSGKSKHRGVLAASFTATADTGAVSLTDATVTGDGSVKTSTGDVTLSDALFGGTVKVRASTGDVALDRADAAELDIETSTGSVKGTLRSEKVFIVRSSSGRVNAPETTSGGKCKVVTSTGSIDLSIAE